MKDIKILIAEDEKNFGTVLKKELDRKGYKVELVENGLEAFNLALKEQFDVVLLDLQMPQMDGVEVLKRIKEENLSPEIIIMTGHATVNTAIEAMKLSAYDYITKPFKIEKLDILIKKAAEKKMLVTENIYLRTRVKNTDRVPTILTKNQKMQDNLRLISKIAPTDSPVTIYGESGTGKELFAKAVHFNSNRADYPFVPINCAALQENILESELFGHEKGSFTGADKQKPGLFEIANKGTLFLDEIAELTLSMQAKLLRVIETNSFFRVGGTREVYVNVRIVSATNKDLKREVEERGFRKDLFYRINMINLTLPSLRERKEDIPLLAEYFTKNNAPSGIKVISPEAMELITEYNWPGNVRELLHVIHRAILLCPGSVIETTDLPLEIQQLKKPAKEERAASGNPKTLQDIEKEYIIAILKEAHGHRGKAAKILGIDPKTLYRKIIAYQIKI
jgi:DNA-binding NtrC family response regulator